ncbi:PREDICTED: BTB/POZ domain-containing protein At5g60050 [Ipomoea nil]|uniref:BTB/POZ domain-containing protein At5g60050 n=1 Tax=Ipomoea nil TaxID=35883 RepID=UPI000901C5E9|nr:PREDICTED: BTB/POZ domain-containing protein At5g60050 [Ipomoea nil]XP_019199258.1 PREDICTED: BTB/POZ domain-containing protein At5g60050 [Ipomoea nil]XP_019199259.1 PREDICTED: BTB/POZ domain-containing protein At5g60050 [Ipomoea nil]XP_019199260.1 PREDICTED: BTB/POZ domain-containing protein At5g60050 [Ipomoea nil]XP_019199261.1 PREDICTED: BTB/POZ domain-containing protein At5g60050 [Ipomoea nil]
MASDNKLKNNQVVSTMIKQGFISDPFFSSPPPTSHHLPAAKLAATAVSPPPAYTPASPPPAPPTQTLFDMMSKEQSRNFRQSPEARHRVQERISRVLAHAPFQSPSRADGNFIDGSGSGGDVKLTIAARDGWPKVSMDVHRRVLAGRSRFFAEKLRRSGSHSVEILDCDDVEVYVKTVVLMYCEDLKKKLIGEGVSKVLGLLKVSSAIMFDAGIMACLEYLEAAPWSSDEEEKVITLLTQLHLPDSATDLLHRVVPEPSTSSGTDDVLLRLLSSVLQAKDDRARKEMKIVISRLLREDVPDNTISRDMLYNLCHGCLNSLLLCASEATCVDESGKDRGVVMGEIAREADNVQWIVDILIERKMGDEFVDLWADQKELASLHSKIPTMYRHEISRITAQLCVAIGRGHLLVPKDARFSLLSTWLEALYEDFGWMRRACRSIDKTLVEDGLSQTILTLPLPQQQAIMLNWFDRFLNKGDDCPNIQKAFQVWWRRAFIKQYVPESQLQIALCDYTN